MRLTLMDSYGFCNWHAWQVPKLPAICSPDTGFSIFASDLLRKFDDLARATKDELTQKRTLRSLLKKLPPRFLPRIKEKQCPACCHVKQFQYYHLKELVDSMQHEEFLNAYKASQGLCLPHFVLLQENFSTHPNFPLLSELQVGKSQSLRTVLEEFIRKQDHRFRDEITAEERNAWKVAMEFVVGKPGVFTNELGHDLLQRSRRGTLSDEEIAPVPTLFGTLTPGELVDEIKRAKETVFYMRRPLPPDLFKELKELTYRQASPTIEIVVEDFKDVGYLRELHSAGFDLFCGIGLPPQTIILLDRKRGFLLEEHPEKPTPAMTRLKNAEDAYLRLLWRRFGHAILLSGQVKEKDIKGGLFCLATDGGREQWCRLKESTVAGLLPAGMEIEVFAWDKWVTRILEVLEVRVLEKGRASPR